MTQMRTRTRFALCLAFVLILLPGAAYASTGALQQADSSRNAIDEVDAGSTCDLEVATVDFVTGSLSTFVANEMEQAQSTIACEAEKANKLLAYNADDIAAIGTQEQSGHGICCPSFSCAYADAVLDGTVHDHDYYSCSCCSWTDWGGGDSSDRCVGSDEQLLREAYDQIALGKPTVAHVSWSGGEHWIALVGYEDVSDPDHLTLANFIALDPWDGARLNAGSKYDLYGDGCEHVSDR